MPKYVMLTTLTAKGVQTLQANPERLKEVNRDVEELGAKVLHQWGMIGAYDFLNIVEAPDAETVAKVSIALGARGSAKLQTFELIEIDSLLARLLFLIVFLARHAESVLNLERRVNGDPSVPLRSPSAVATRPGCSVPSSRTPSSTSASIPGSRAHGRRPSWRSATGRSRSRSSPGSTTSRSASSTVSRSPATAR